MPKKKVKATATLKDNVLVETQARGHKLMVDEPKNQGGTDQGMNPVELLLSALGSCQSIVARTYADRFDIDLKNFWVELEGDLNTDGFLDIGDVRPGYSAVRYTFHIETNASQEKVEAFTEFIEAHCPVGDTIANTVQLVSNGTVIEKPVN